MKSPETAEPRPISFIHPILPGTYVHVKEFLYIGTCLTYLFTTSQGAGILGENWNVTLYLGNFLSKLPGPTRKGRSHKRDM